MLNIGNLKMTKQKYTNRTIRPMLPMFVLSLALFAVLNISSAFAQDYEMTLNQRRMGSQIGVEVWVKALKANTPNLGNMTVPLVYNEAFLKPANIETAGDNYTGNPAEVTDSVYYDLNTTQPFITIESPFGNSQYGFNSIQARAVEVNNGGVTGRVFNLETVLNPSSAGFQASMSGKGTFVGLLKFNIIEPDMAKLTDDELTQIEFNKKYDFCPTLVVTDKDGNDISASVTTATTPDFAIRDITILSPNNPGNIIKRYNNPALASIAPNNGYPIYFERSGLLDDVETYGTYGTETLAYEVSLSLNNGASYVPMGRFAETSIDANSMSGKNDNYASGEIARLKDTYPYYVTKGDGKALPTAAERPSYGYGGVLRFILSANENYAFRSEEALFKITQLEADKSDKTFSSDAIINRGLISGEGRFDVTDYSLVLSRMFFVQFNGKDQYMRTPYNITSPTQVTVSAWVNLNSKAAEDAEPGIVCCGNATSDNYGPWMLYLKNGAYPAFRAIEKKADTQDSIVADIVSPIALTTVGDTPPLDYSHGDNWYHIAATVKEGFVTLYLNGEVVAQSDNNDGVIKNMYEMQFPIYIGVNPHNGGLDKPENYINAGIKEVKFWRSAMTQDEIRKYIAGIYQPNVIGSGQDDRYELELYYPLQGTMTDYADVTNYQWGQQDLVYYSGGVPANNMIHYRPDRAHITLTSPIGGEGVSNLKNELYEVRWAGYGLGSVNPNTNDLQIMISRDGGTSWFDAIGEDASPALPLDQVEIEDGTAKWSPYNNTTLTDYDNDLQSVVAIEKNYSKECIMRISGTEEDGLDGIYATSSPFYVAPNFAFANEGTARVTINENSELSFTGNINMIEAWIKPYRFPTEQEGSFPIFNKKDGADMQYAFRLNPDGRLSLSIKDTLTKNIVTAYSTNKVTKPNSEASDSTWTHVVAYVNLAAGGKSSHVRFYIDGLTDYSTETVTQLGSNVNVDRNNKYPCYIAYEPLSSDFNDATHFIGEIKEVRFWNGNPGDVELTSVEPSPLTLFIQGAQGIRAKELTTFAGTNYSENLVAAWSCNGGSWINRGLQRSVEVYPTDNPNLIAVVYGEGYEYKATQPFIKIVEPQYQQNVSNLSEELRVRWVGWDYDRNDGKAPFRNGSSATAHADLDFSSNGGGGKLVQPYQAVASQAYNDSYQNALMFNYLNEAYEFVGTGSRTQFAANLNMSVTDPDANDDYTYSDQGPIPAAQTNGRLKLIGRATINGSELTYDNVENGNIEHLMSESDLFNITPPSNFTVRVLLEGYHTGTDKNTGGIKNDLGKSFNSKGLKIALYENQANLPGRLVASGESVDGYFNADAMKIENREAGKMNYGNVPFVFTDVKDGRYFVTVDHINHLPITSAYAAPFYFSGDDQTTDAVESGWDFTKWNGVTNNELTADDAQQNPPAMANKYAAKGPSETNSNESAYGRTQLRYNNGQAGSTTEGMIASMVAGDVYRDGKIDALDRSEVNRNVGGVVAYADVTGDGYVNATDRTIVYRNKGIATSEGDHPAGAVVTQYTPAPIAAPLQMADFHSVNTAEVAAMVRAEQEYYENGGTTENMPAKFKIKNRLQGINIVDYEVSADVEKIDDYIDVAVYIKNNGGNWAIGNATIGLKFDETALRFDSYFGTNSVLFNDNSSAGYGTIFSNPSENTINPIAGLRTIDIKHGQDAPGQLSGIEVPAERTYLGTLRFHIERVADYHFSWHKEMTVVHDVDGLTLTPQGEFKYIEPILIERNAEITYPTAGSQLVAEHSYKITWTEPTNKDMNVDILFSKDNGNSWAVINPSPIAIGEREYRWDTPSINSANCVLQLREVETESIIDVTPAFAVLSAPIEIIAPCSICGTLTSGTQSDIIWNTERDEDVFFEFSANGKDNWIAITGMVSTTALSTPFTVPEARTSSAVVRMVDNNGNVLSVSTPFSVLSGSLAITYPNGDMLKGNTTIDVAWTNEKVEMIDIQFSKDGGQTWGTIAENINANTNSFNWLVPNIDCDDARLRATVAGEPNLVYSVSKFMIYPEWGSVEDPALYGYTLSSAVPNPFAETTTLHFSIPETENVSVELYDITGNKVADVLTSQIFTAGTHLFSIDAADLATGTYIVRVNTSRFTLTERVLLIK